MKKVVMILVDSLSQHTLDESLMHRSAPVLQFLREHAAYIGTATTVYPTMTATIDCSMLSGEYPDRHQVPGLVWYDEQQKQMVNYLNGWQCVIASGVRRSIRQNLFDLNERHLSPDVETIYEELTRRGQTSASINGLVHRGLHRHRLHLPAPFRWLLRKIPRVSGPEHFVFGHLTRNRWQSKMPRHLYWPWRAYGINDGYAVKALAAMIRAGKQPDFTFVYLPDHDHAMHRKNPAHMRDAILQLDHALRQIMDAFGDWRTALREATWILTSDHGQSQIAKPAISQIELAPLLKHYCVLPLRAKAKPKHQLAVANNERMAYLYPLDSAITSSLKSRLCSEARFDAVAWKEHGGIEVRQGGSGLRTWFARAADAPTNGNSICTDEYGATWRLEGDLRVLDLHIQDGILNYGDYPDALARIHGALFAHRGDVILVNARPRYEIHLPTFPRHKNGGAHGSLHRIESQVPLWISGGPDGEKPHIDLPQHPRIIDYKRLILRMLEPDATTRGGEGR